MGVRIPKTRIHFPAFPRCARWWRPCLCRGGKFKVAEIKDGSDQTAFQVDAPFEEADHLRGTRC